MNDYLRLLGRIALMIVMAAALAYIAGTLSQYRV